MCVDYWPVHGPCVYEWPERPVCRLVSAYLPAWPVRLWWVFMCVYALACMCVKGWFYVWRLLACASLCGLHVYGLRAFGWLVCLVLVCVFMIGLLRADGWPVYLLWVVCMSIMVVGLCPYIVKRDASAGG